MYLITKEAIQCHYGKGIVSKGDYYTNTRYCCIFVVHAIAGAYEPHEGISDCVSDVLGKVH